MMPVPRSIRHALAVATILLGIPAIVTAAVLMPPNFVDEELVGGLDRPTSMAFLPDGRILVTEQWTGTLRLIVPGSWATPVVYGFSDVSVEYERGLLSVAVDPGWPERPYIYLFYTNSGGFSRLVRLTGSGDLTDGGSGLTFADPLIVLDELPDNSPIHNGGGLAFDPDGMLYLGLGDDGDACLAQDSTSLHGCILRINVRDLQPYGSAPPSLRSLAPHDNPWHSERSPQASLVYARGFRNPFRIQVDPADGQIYVGDVGMNLWEELDAPKAGSNAGWPHREGSFVGDWPYCPEPGGRGVATFLEPIDEYLHGPHSGVIIAAGVFRPDMMATIWPHDWDGAVFYADWLTGFVRMIRFLPGAGWIRLQGNGLPGPADWATGLPSPVDFKWGPDGNLWWLSYQDPSDWVGTGTLHRMRYQVTAAGIGDARKETVAIAATPNPSRSAVDLTFTLPSASHVRLDIHDLAGRRVATVVDQDLPPGLRQTHWDGRNAHGIPVSAGLYVARLSWDRGSSTIRMVRVH